MKKIAISAFILFCFIIAVLMFFSLNKKEDNSKKEIKIFCWGQYMSDGTDDSLNVVEAFEKEEKINVAAFNTFDSCEQMYAKLKNGNSNYDVIFSCDYMVKQLIDENLIQPIDKSRLKNYKNIMENCKGSVWGYDPDDKFCVPYNWGTVGIIYNKEKIEQLTNEKAEKVVTGWESLWDERLKQEILMFINSRDSFSIAHKILKNSVNTTKKEDILNASKLLKKQKPLVQAYLMDEMFDKMENDEAAISVAYSGDIVNMMKNNKKLRYCFPKEGTNIFIDAICIPSNAKNVDGALKFIDFLCREDVALANAEFLSYSTPNKKALSLMEDELKNNEIAYPKEERIKKCEAHLPLSKEQNMFIETLWANIRN